MFVNIAAFGEPVVPVRIVSLEAHIKQKARTRCELEIENIFWGKRCLCLKQHFLHISCKSRMEKVVVCVQDLAGRV
jgi:hypothetical protein